MKLGWLLVIAVAASACGADREVDVSSSTASSSSASSAGGGAMSSSAATASSSSTGGGGAGGAPSEDQLCKGACEAQTEDGCMVKSTCESDCLAFYAMSPQCKKEIDDELQCFIDHAGETTNCKLSSACTTAYGKAGVCTSGKCSGEMCSGDMNGDCMCTGTCSMHDVGVTCTSGVCDCLVDGAPITMCTEKGNGCGLVDSCCALVFASL